jgi:predicted ArsR family transcriptional regulator
VDRLPLFKALADGSRYSIYLEVARSSVPLSTTEVAERLGLHPNTVRPHLERMREVGLLVMSTESHGSVGRPQHRWSVPPQAPSLGLEPPGLRLLARLLAEAAALGSPGPDELCEIGRGQARERAEASRAGRSGRGSGLRPACVQAIIDELADLGFDPVVDSEDGATLGIAFTRCPFRELATAYPDLVCQLHRGLTEGIVEKAHHPDEAPAARIVGFSTLVDPDPCRVEVSTGA